MKDIILETIELTKNYGKIRAINGLNLSIGKGEIFGILGPNGSGKTTTLSIITGAVYATSGVFNWFGKDGRLFDRRCLGVLLETPNFYPYLSGYHNLKIPARIKGASEDDIWRALRRAGLEDRAKHRFRTYSFGMKQRLAIASALLGNPSVLILDEPTNGLDPQGIAEIRELILRIATDGITIILASHLLDEVQKVCTHVGVLRAGKLLYAGRVDQMTGQGNTFLLAASDMEALRSAILKYVKVQDIVAKNGFLEASFEAEITAENINRYLFENGVTLQFLMAKKQSLEENFLNLLNQH
jgi:ABC-2 type transport system ATP-binding protein